MQRQSDKHSPKKDDQLKKEMRAQTRTGRPTRSEEWREPEALTRDEETSPERRPGRDT
ncbi:hypothetical protein J7W19_30935 [Streptomyces mobaraensis NBRC 13819 = DSM 40847]|uniref:Uncharacterized protein n=1 Tax=Streptomyces mobaraensis (strain ATCC 29032 / DSM 40847 / JCM 4168 / NBRC 13819 / NCIMB 11159 / IPCR 16-22) TaxID=1223523 RepID=M3A7Z6_STRM1|nr:hypothetical protein [Streptomyces mobaraensis]EMF01294.1 hypothetical protein H340_06816 [Streptomyces mobaraensis NBRC 13819 = DSM 40847]QTT77216.1 hypothetical protein J7W19_30935 [Streptomyces mobaraensis NBRC 13819 = DSM 40847]